MNCILRLTILGLLLGFCGLESHQAMAQHRFRASIGRAEVGGSFVNTSELNQVLENEGFAPVDGTILAFGLSTSRFAGHLVYGGKLYNYMIAKSGQVFQSANMHYHYLIPYIGPVLYKDETEWLVYATFGAGLGVSNLKARPVGSQFPENHNTTGLLFDAALNISHKFNEIPDVNKGFEVGMSIGYLYSRDDSFRMVSFGSPENGTLVSPAGPYFRLTLGMMSWD